MTDEYFMFLAVIIWSVEPLCQCLLVCPTKKKKVKQKSSSEDELENRPDTKFGRGKKYSLCSVYIYFFFPRLLSPFSYACSIEIGWVLVDVVGIQRNKNKSCFLPSWAIKPETRNTCTHSTHDGKRSSHFSLIVYCRLKKMWAFFQTVYNRSGEHICGRSDWYFRTNNPAQSVGDTSG